MLNSIKEKSVALILFRPIHYTLAILIFACLIFYVYFANTAVHTLTMLEKTKGELQSLSVEVSELEGKRLFVQNSINKALAQSLGFVSVSEQTFIVNKSKKTTLSFNTD